MTALVWDQIGERRFETGVDRGVLYLPSGVAVPWNGLTSVTEERGREIKEYYQDGFKYLEQYLPGVFSGKIQAFTYPDELEACLGLLAFAPGVFLHDQESKGFSLSYRTQIGNDVDGIDYGYKLHVLYNLKAIPASAQFDTLSGSLTPQMLEWALTSMPDLLSGVHPTNHVSFNSRLINPTLLAEIEETLYGNASTAPTLPTLADLVNMT